MDLVGLIVTAVLSVCCLCATAAPQARLPWEKLSPASPVYHNTDDILRFEPLTAVDSIWESFKAEHSMRIVHFLYLKRCFLCFKLQFDVLHRLYPPPRLSWIISGVPEQFSLGVFPAATVACGCNCYKILKISLRNQHIYKVENMLMPAIYDCVKL